MKNGKKISGGDVEVKVSVVVPVYNAEKYLELTIKSVLFADENCMSSVQLVLVNDGSTDASEKIALEYKELYPNNIVYVATENHGPSHARNIGLKNAKGKYVVFLDSDDELIFDNMLEAIAIADEFETDILFTTYRNFMDGENKNEASSRAAVFRNIKKDISVLELESVKSFLFSFGHMSVCSAVWRKEFLFENDLWLDEEVVLLEDFLYNCLARVLANKIGVYREPLFDRRRRVENSLSNRSYANEKGRYALFKLKEELEKRGVFEEYESAFVKKIVTFIRAIILHRSNIYDEFMKQSSYFRDVGFDRLGITEEAAKKYLSDYEYLLYFDLMKGSNKAFTHFVKARLIERIKENEKKVTMLKKTIKNFKERNKVLSGKVETLRTQKKFLKERVQTLESKLKVANNTLENKIKRNLRKLFGRK